MQVTKRGVALTKEERAAVNKAHDIIVERFAAAGEPYDYKMREMVEYWLFGALYTTGIEGMMKCAAETKIVRKGSATA